MHPDQKTVPHKANRILNGLLILLLLVGVRVWHLTTFQHEKSVEASLRPQQRVVMERAERATICDRFEIPLAKNQVQYNAAISYGAIRALPRWEWALDESGKRVKRFKRREYITELSHLLGEKLMLDPERVEDLIHSRAAILGNVPCVIKENLSEGEYFQLRMMEKDWPGVFPEVVARRTYPLGKCASEVVGYLGSIGQESYARVTRKMRILRECLSKWEEGQEPELPSGFSSLEEVSAALEELERSAYTVNDLVGKAGVEAVFDHSLRGERGKHTYLSDTRGNFLQTLSPSYPSTPGNKVYLTLSAELQAYAEELLLEYETRPSPKKEAVPKLAPWIKGGAIVVMEPKSGEILALASYPQFDPNDFIRSGNLEEDRAKNRSIYRWLESNQYIANIWNAVQPLERERFDPVRGEYSKEALELSWEHYLQLILPEKSPVLLAIKRASTVKDAAFVQTKVAKLLAFFGDEEKEMAPIKVFDALFQSPQDHLSGAVCTLEEKERLLMRYEAHQEEITLLLSELMPYFSSLHYNSDKLLLVDLYRLALDPSLFSEALLEKQSALSLEAYREYSALVTRVRSALKEIVQELFHEIYFKKWRREHFKEYLAQKRKEEKKEGKKYAKPYIDYLDERREKQFYAFWEAHQITLLESFIKGLPLKEELAPFEETLFAWREELCQGAHLALDFTSHWLRLQEMLPLVESECLKTVRSFEMLSRPLLGVYSGIRSEKGGAKERHLAGAFYPKYGFGYARSHSFRQAATIGSLFKVVPAYEALRQLYEKEAPLTPLTIVDDKHRGYQRQSGWNVGYTSSGKTIPMYYKGGRLPRSEHSGIGKVDLISALETSSNPYFSLLAGDVLDDPDDLCRAAREFSFGQKTGVDLTGEFAGYIPEDVTYNRTGLYAMAIGQHSLVGTPLQVTSMLATLANGGFVLKPKIVGRLGESDIATEEKGRVHLPSSVQHLLIQGLKQVVVGERGTARFMKGQFPGELLYASVGKTSTAEAMERMSVDAENGLLKTKHVWFGAISYATSALRDPELVVVVYLRHGQYGRLAAPYAYKVIQKWREIQSRRGGS